LWTFFKFIAQVFWFTTWFSNFTIFKICILIVTGQFLTNRKISSDRFLWKLRAYLVNPTSTWIDLDWHRLREILICVEFFSVQSTLIPCNKLMVFEFPVHWFLNSRFVHSSIEPEMVDFWFYGWNRLIGWFDRLAGRFSIQNSYTKIWWKTVNKSFF
jgi:hypothetical protein